MIDQLVEEVAEQERRWRLVTGMPDTGSLHVKALFLDILANLFSDEELKNLSFELGADYEKLPGSSKLGKARELILWCDRRNRLKRLYDKVRMDRPYLFEDRS